LGSSSIASLTGILKIRRKERAFARSRKSGQARCACGGLGRIAPISLSIASLTGILKIRRKERAFARSRKSGQARCACRVWAESPRF